MNRQLPEDFLRLVRTAMGEDRFARFEAALGEEPPVSIRLNPLKAKSMQPVGGIGVPWCSQGFYLSARPNFTFDPLLHAGCYYVQEAASMFIDLIVRQHITHPIAMLDLCAAPGGKSTALLAALPEGSRLVSNEPVRQRYQVLSENLAKWGYAGSATTNRYPADFRRDGVLFDAILCDVPCSGEGMFRKDPATIREWSPQQVGKCWQLQRDIVDDAWACLNDGGLLIYSTCTFNTKENEENIRWMLEEFDDAESIPVDVNPDWHITGSLLPGFDEPVYRFIPGISRGEGLFMCVLRKKGCLPTAPSKRRGSATASNLPLLLEGAGGKLAETWSESVELSYPQAISYLRGEALVLPDDTPRGIIEVCFMGHPLGQVKNIGSRANNLYPKPWRIKTTYIPQEYTPILTNKSSLNSKL